RRGPGPPERRSMVATAVPARTAVLTEPAMENRGEEVSMNRFLSGASRAVGANGLGSLWTWLIAGAVTLGIVPAPAQAQDSPGYGQAGPGQAAPTAAATLFGL